MHSGKTTLKDAVTERLRAEGHRVETVSFATPLKDAVDQVARSLFQRGFIAPEAYQRYMSDKAERRPEYQLIGGVLRKYDIDVWANLAVRYAESFGSGVVFVNDDLRFPNEVLALRNTDTLVVRLEAPREIRNARAPLVNENDVSETALDGFQDFDLVLDSSRVSVEEEVQMVLQALQEREMALPPTRAA